MTITEGGNTFDIPLAGLDGLGAGGGSTAVINSTSTVTVVGDGSSETPYELTTVGGGGGTTEVVDGTTLTGIGTSADPFKIEPGTEGQFLATNTAGEVIWSGLPPSAGGEGGGAIFTDESLSGDGSSEAFALSIAEDAITTGRILDGEVQTADLADANITLAKIQPLSPAPATSQMLVTTSAGAVEWAPVSAGGGTTEVADQTTITGDGQPGTELQVADGGINTLQLADDAVNSSKILNGEVQTDDIADANITLSKIQPLTPAPATDQMLVTTTAGSVEWAPVPAGGGTTEVADQTTITGDGQPGTELQVADGGINTLQLADDAVNSSKILNGEVQTDDLADANITLAKIQPLTPAPATDQMLVTTTAGAVEWAPVPAGGGTTEVADQTTITGDGQPGTELQVADGGINTLQLGRRCGELLKDSEWRSPNRRPRGRQYHIGQNTATLTRTRNEPDAGYHHDRCR